jgi:hypothetical protein
MLGTSAINVPYQACSLRWFESESELDVYDLALFAALAYEDETTVRDVLNVSYPAWVLKDSIQRRSLSTVRALHLLSPSNDVSVVVIRGSWTFLDMVQDCDIWTESVFAKMTVRAIPFGSYFAPLETMQALVHAISFLERLFPVQRRHYYEGVSTSLKDLAVAHGEDKVLVVGHSLGGGVAHISGVQNNVRAVSFNGPGIAYAARKLGLDSQAIAEKTYTIMTDGDMVSRVDLHLGGVQDIRCKGSEVVEAANCHKVTDQAAEILESCGFERKGCLLSSGPKPSTLEVVCTRAESTPAPTITPTSTPTPAPTTTPTSTPTSALRL